MKNKIRPDIVYLWVDWSDKEWLEKRKTTYNQMIKSKTDIDNLGKYANVDGRFRDNNELLYNLRSLMPFLNEINHIYIVTDKQIPKWLKLNDKISIVDHRDIFNPYHQTFSSPAIEANIHNIKNISQNIIYLNDDTFLGPNFNFDEIFNWVKTIGFFPEKQTDDKNDPNRAHYIQPNISKNILLDMWYDISTINTQPLSHSPKIINIKRLKELSQKIPDIFHNTSLEIFRTKGNSSIISDLYFRWMLANWDIKISHLNHMLINLWDSNFDKEVESFKKDHNNLVYFCFNDTLDDEPDDHPNIIKFKNTMEELYPQKSIFEK